MSVKLKGAIKTGLAFMLVYYIALKSGWLNRLAGTIPACTAAIVILSLAL